MSEAAVHGDGHDHDHPPFLAHHFDDPEQQYDSGKLGMWLFLVTEILFFSGMFCAYALYRSIHPEVWTFASRFLNPTLGAINTGVLLFSSLTMAWAVRCAQLRQRTGLVVSLAATLGCASIFLGVKAIEYTHKWELGLLPAGTYESQFLPSVVHHGISDWLYVLSAVPAVCVVGFGIWYAMTLAKGEKENAEVAGTLLITALCFFVGAGLGLFLEGGEEHGNDHGPGTHSEQPTDGHEHSGGVHEGEHGEEGERGHKDVHEGEEEKHSMLSGSTKVVFVSLTEEAGMAPAVKPGAVTEKEIDQRGGAGLFFSIYYCMTGVHAVHIIAGMIVLAWLLVRATRDHFNEQYFGPVDYVGLYWHVVDLIWIYLFPLLYLIK